MKQNAVLRGIADVFRRTPLHPQWLLGSRVPPSGKELLRGIVLDVGAADRWIEKTLNKDCIYIAADLPMTGALSYETYPHVYCDAMCLPFSNDSVDAIICLEVLEHVPDPFAALSEFQRVLKSDSVALLSVPFMYPVHDAPYDFQRFTEFGLRKILTKAGFTVESLVKSGHSVKAAAMLLCLSIAGGLLQLPLFIRALALPFAVALIAVINISAAALSVVWPDWPSLGSGYDVVARKV